MQTWFGFFPIISHYTNLIVFFISCRTLCRSITMVCKIGNIPRNILGYFHIPTEKKIRRQQGRKKGKVSWRKGCQVAVNGHYHASRRVSSTPTKRLPAVIHPREFHGYRRKARRLRGGIVSFILRVFIDPSSLSSNLHPQPVVVVCPQQRRSSARACWGRNPG